LGKFHLSNFNKAKMLEADYLKQIKSIIKKAGSQNQLSIFIYGNENTLQAKLLRAKKSSPLKLMTYYQIIQDYEKKARGNAV